MSSEKIIVLYERLSREDENLGESYSISNQKKLLEDYCREKGWTRFRHFTDDGISGTTFDRPSFKAMIQLVEDGEVETIILKDMSRLGRDYLVVGQLREFFRKKGVRLIAINDNHDSYNGDDDFLVFRDVMNEMYAKDISKKIKSTFKSKGKSGKHVASVTPYGYLKDENDGNHWIVDEEAAEIVRLIFKWTIDGLGPYQIAKLLQEKKVEIPAVHMARFGQGNNRNKKVKDPYGWGSSTVVGILKKREYLGHTVNFKTQKHFKDKKSHYVSEDNWVIFENTQEPIIDQQTFDTVQKLRENVRRYRRGGAFCKGIVNTARRGGLPFAPAKGSKTGQRGTKLSPLQTPLTLSCAGYEYCFSLNNREKQIRTAHRCAPKVATAYLPPPCSPPP